MIQENTLDARTKLSQLVEAAERGEEVFIVKNGVPVAKIVPVKKAKFNSGFLKDEIPEVSDSMLFAMSDEEAELFPFHRGMKPLHQDPFHRVLMARASNRNIYLATLDQDILRYFHKDKPFYVFADRTMQE